MQGCLNNGLWGYRLILEVHLFFVLSLVKKFSVCVLSVLLRVFLKSFLVYFSLFLWYFLLSRHRKMVNFFPSWGVSVQQRSENTIQKHFNELVVESIFNHLDYVIFSRKHLTLVLMDQLRDRFLHNSGISHGRMVRGHHVDLRLKCLLSVYKILNLMAELLLESKIVLSCEF